MYEKIVVPLDGSPLAEVALPYAEELAGKTRSEIILLSVLPSEETREYQKCQRYANKIVDVTKCHVERFCSEATRLSCW